MIFNELKFNYLLILFIFNLYFNMKCRTNHNLITWNHFKSETNQENMQ